MFDLFVCHVRSGKHIQHGCDIDTDALLEFDDFFDANLHIAVNVGLEGARIGHHNTGEIQQFVDSICSCFLLQFIVLPNDVRVGNQRSNAVSVPHFSRFNGSDVWIDDGEQCWGFKNAV